MAKLRVHLALPYAEYMKFYQGQARAVSARTTDGRTIQFPARSLQPFLTHQGIYGEFEIEFSDDAHKLVGVRRVP
ncbi:MAG: DUF2835 domain-containing protein [Gammaproteobacteria bacterium]|nr:DUF2835 domain-containing protein [Gammaproteobacteria bacterium]